jgi:DNA-binding FadR family transcriptional regulator
VRAGRRAGHPGGGHLPAVRRDQYARLQLEPLAAALAAENITEAGISRLRAILDDESARRREPGVFSHNVLHTALGELSGNPVLHLFVEVLTRLSARYAHTARSISSEMVTAGKDRAHLCHVDIVGAVIAGDAAAAQNLHADHLNRVADWMRDHHADGGQDVIPDMSDLSDMSQVKLAEVVAGRIHDEIVRGGWRVGEVIGSEAELLSRHDVSRAALREAVRLLEYHSVARMRRGPGGGLVITEPRPRASIESISLYLDRQGVGGDDLRIVREAVELGVLRRVMAEGAPPGALERLEGVLTYATPGVDPDRARVERFHAALAEHCGNPVLALFQGILAELWSQRVPDDLPPSGTGRSNAAEAERVHRWIFEAIRDGDEGMAMHRMRRHIAAPTAW